MKRIFTLSVILVVTSLLLPSCGMHMTVAKRQHSKGYYVDISSDKKLYGKQAAQKETPETESRQEAIARHEAPVKTIAANETAEVAEINTVISEDETSKEETTEAAVLPVAKHVREKSHSREKPGIETVPAEKKQGSDMKSLVNKKVNKFKQSSKEQVQKMESSRRAAGSGLSLFWIVILVLLILWALGYIGGLGGFIHIALVVALILLILWLLGIV